jgi:copper transport protein
MVHACSRRIEMRRARRAAASFLLALSLLIGAEPMGVAAHAELVASTPAAGASLPEAPAAISLTFTEPIDPATARVRLLGANQDVVDAVGGLRVDQGRTMATVSLPELDPGVYTVDYQVVSAVDGHATSGLFAFLIDPTGAEPPPATQPTSAAPAADVAAIVARWVALALALATFGTALFWARHAASLRPHDGARQVGPWLLLAALSAGGFGALATYLALAARPLVAVGTHDVHRSFPLDFAAPFGWTPFGIAMRLALGALGLCFVVAVFRTVRLDELRRRGTEPAARERLFQVALIALAAAALLGMSLAGHVAALGGAPFAMLDWAHLLAAGAWLGAIPAFGVVAARAKPPDRSGSLRAAMRLHGPTAMVAAPVVALTGLANSPLVLGRARELVASPYGNLLIAKAALVSVALAIGAANHLLLRRRQGPGGAGLARLVGLEVAVAAFAVLAAATLVTIQPGAARQPVLTGPSVQPAHFFGEAGPSYIHASVSVPAPGEQTYQVVVRDGASGAPRSDVQAVFVSFIPPEGSDLPAKRVELDHTEIGGLYAASGDHTPVAGDWGLDVVVRRAGEPEELVSFGMSVEEPSPPRRAPPPDTGIAVPAPLAILWNVLPAGIGGWIPAAAAIAAVVLLGRWPARAHALRIVLLGVAVVLVLAVGSRTVVALANQPTPAELTEFAPSATASVTSGERIYLANCASCHGADGRGDGPANPLPAPRPLSEVVAGVPSPELSYRIANGLAGTPMPAFSASLTEQEMRDLIAYLEQRWGAP